MGLNGKKIVSIFVLLVFLCGMYAGCAKNEKELESRETVSEAELEVWTFFDINTPDSYYVDLWDTLAEQYGVSIDVKTYSTEQIKDKLRIALACNELPDIFLVWGGNYPNYLFDAGACIPVQDAMEASDVVFLDSYTKPYTDGNNYIIPCLVEAYAVTYYNSELMEKMNLQEPHTWDELLELIEKVNDYNDENGTDYAAIELGEKDSWLGELLYCMIVNRIDPYAYDRLKSGEIDFSDPVFTDAAEKIRSLVEMGAFPADYMETGEVESVENFINGEAVLFPHQSTIVYYLMQNMGEDDFGMIQFPDCGEEFDEAYASYMMDINHTLTPGLCVSSRSEYQEEALELCMEFAKQVNQVNVTEYGYLNMTEETLDPPDNLPSPVQEFRDMIDSANKFTAYWYAELEPESGDSWRNLTKKLFAGERNVEDFIREGSDYLKWISE
jgi:raffinose/stachyose/melibiose transport system substrate-binding protein